MDRTILQNGAGPDLIADLLDHIKTIWIFLGSGNTIEGPRALKYNRETSCSEIQSRHGAFRTYLFTLSYWVNFPPISMLVIGLIIMPSNLGAPVEKDRTSSGRPDI